MISINKKLKYIYIVAVFTLTIITTNVMESNAPPVCRECVRTDGAPTPHGDMCVFADVNHEFDFSMLCTQCLQCANMEKWLEAYNSGNDDTPPAPRPHSKSCPLRPKFDFSMQCVNIE